MNVLFSNNFKRGRKILYNSEPYVIEFSEFIKPGKGQAFVRLKLRRLLIGTLITKTVRASECFQLANIEKFKFVYLFNDTMNWYFLNPKNFEQISISKNIIADKKKWLLPKDLCNILFWNKKPISIILNNFVFIKVIENCTLLNQDSSIADNKIVKLSTNVKIKVPDFIKVGDVIKVDTRSETYVSRIK